jgi:hypothetical protein
MKSLNRMLNLHRLSSCTLQLRTSHGYLLPRTDSSLNRTNSITHIAEERTHITGNVMWPTTHRCLTSPRTPKTQLPLFLCVGPCLQRCCLATRWSNPLHYSLLRAAHPSSLLVHCLFFFPRSLLNFISSSLPLLVFSFSRWLLPNRYHCSLLKTSSSQSVPLQSSSYSRFSP